MFLGDEKTAAMLNVIRVSGFYTEPAVSELRTNLKKTFRKAFVGQRKLRVSVVPNT